MEILRVEGYRKFCNKIFNATKFAMLKFDEQFKPNVVTQPTGNERIVEKWILHKLNIAAKEINQELTERNFMAATNVAYNFWLYELCDVYIVSYIHLVPKNIPYCLFAGGDEAYDGSFSLGHNARLSSTNALHVLGPWPPPAASIHAFRH